jgi:hypothetical protein
MQHRKYYGGEQNSPLWILPKKKIKIHQREMQIYSHASTIPSCYITDESDNEPVNAKN